MIPLFRKRGTRLALAAMATLVTQVALAGQLCYGVMAAGSALGRPTRAAGQAPEPTAMTGPAHFCRNGAPALRNDCLRMLSSADVAHIGPAAPSFDGLIAADPIPPSALVVDGFATRAPFAADTAGHAPPAYILYLRFLS